MQQRGQDPHSRQQFHSDMPDEWTAEEEGLRYYLRRNQSLSPGLFLDQRANRRWLRDQSTDRSVLNLFSYTGGFSLNAAFGGAHQVVSVDLSRSFLAWSRANFALNKIDAEHHEFWLPMPATFFAGVPGGADNLTWWSVIPPRLAGVPTAYSAWKKICLHFCNR